MSTPINWPSGLPQFLLSPYRVAPRSGTLDPRLSGIPSKSRVYPRTTEIVAIACLFTPAEEQAFRTFYRTDLYRGTLFFNAPILANGTLENREVQFIGAPPRFEAVTPTLVRMTATLVTRDSATTKEAEPPPSYAKWLNLRDARNLATRTYTFEYRGTTRYPASVFPTRIDLADAIADAAGDIGYDPGVIFGWRNVDDETLVGPPYTNITDFDADTLEFHYNLGDPEATDFYDNIPGINACAAMASVGATQLSPIWWVFTQFASVYGSGLWAVGPFFPDSPGWVTVIGCPPPSDDYSNTRPDILIRATVDPL